MNVRAKFRCLEVRHLHVDHPTDRMAEIRLQAVWADGKGNASWSKFTPQGELRMMVTTDAIDAFVLGQDYMIDFTPVPKG